MACAPCASCIVWFASSDDWDNQFEGHTYGWLSFFQILRLYLEHFRGQPCSPVQLMAMSSEQKRKAWDALTLPLDLGNASIGAHVTTRSPAPELSGVIEVVNPPEWPGLILRLDKPAPALAHFFAMSLGGPVMLPVRFYLYGDAAADVARTSKRHGKHGSASGSRPFRPRDDDVAALRLALLACEPARTIARSADTRSARETHGVRDHDGASRSTGEKVRVQGTEPGKDV